MMNKKRIFLLLMVIFFVVFPIMAAKKTSANDQQSESRIESSIIERLTGPESSIYVLLKDSAAKEFFPDIATASVVRKKITMPRPQEKEEAADQEKAEPEEAASGKPAPEPVKAPPVETPPAEPEGAVVKEIKPPPAIMEKPTVVEAVPEKIEPPKTEKVEAIQPKPLAAPSLAPVVTSPGAGASSGKITIAYIEGIEQKIKPPDETNRYNPEGRMDPFKPLFKEEPKAPSPEELAAKKKERIKRVPQGPLEKVDLSQLKLVGIIRADSGNKAMVELSSGKGFIVSKGTYIGNRAGKIVEILKDRLVVAEEFEDYLGNLSVKNRDLKIAKPPGEEYYE